MHDEPNVERWLLLLRDGSEAEQQLARTELGLILEARGLLDEAAEAFERNVAEGTTDRRPYERLAAIARLRGDAAAEARALRGLAELLSPAPPPPAPAPVVLEPDLPLPAFLAVPEREEQDEEHDAQPEGQVLEPRDNGAEKAGAETVADARLAESEDLTDEPLIADTSLAVGPAVKAQAPAIDDADDSTAAVEKPPSDESVDDPAETLVDTSASLADVDEPEADADAPVALDGQPDDDVVAATSPSDEPVVPTPPDDPDTASTAIIVALDPETLLAGAPPPQLPPAPLPLIPADSDQAAPISPLSAPEMMSAKPILAPRSGAGGVRSPGADELRSPSAAVETLLSPSLPTPEPAPSKPVFSRWLPTLIGLVLVIVVVGGALMVPVSRPLNVAPAKPAPSPMTIEQQLLASTPTALPSPSPSPAPAVAVALAPSPTVVVAPLPARCAAAALRFPESLDSEAAVRAAFREYMGRQGVTIDASSTLFTGLGEAYAGRHAEVMAGWMAVTLQRERRSLPTFPLVDYVASDIIVAAGPGEYLLRATISPQGWNELRALPPDSCEGAYLRSPENAGWVGQMPASVGDIRWALPPTAQPGR